ncbi:MAG: LysR family transcriptional regulator [Alphaproteobacteria bacterium]|nr:LysR family transcriptional regulator [Alphaproteobacteria bacterium]
MQHALDGDLLQAFAAFADTLNFTHAARQVGLSQPALHERVGRLSEALGVQLYLREGRNLALTEDGVAVAAYARESLSRSARFLATLKGEAEDRVALAAGKGAYLYLLGPALRAFRARAAAQLTLLSLGGPDAARAVRAGEVQLAFGAYDLIHPELEAVEVLRTGACAALSTDHPLAGRASLRLEELGGERFILAPEGQRHRELMTRALAAAGVPVESSVEADGWPLMLAFAAAGQGVAFVNATCHAPPGCALVPLPELGELRYRLLRRRAAPPNPAAEALAACILEAWTRKGP